jgi:hypothetical protein
MTRRHPAVRCIALALALAGCSGEQAHEPEAHHEPPDRGAARVSIDPATAAESGITVEGQGRRASPRRSCSTAASSPTATARPT